MQIGTKLIYQTQYQIQIQIRNEYQISREDDAWRAVKPLGTTQPLSKSAHHTRTERPLLCCRDVIVWRPAVGGRLPTSFKLANISVR